MARKPAERNNPNPIGNPADACMASTHASARELEHRHQRRLDRFPIGLNRKAV